MPAAVDLAQRMTASALPSLADEQQVVQVDVDRLLIDLSAGDNFSHWDSPVTLGDLVNNDKLLWVYCCDCGHERDVNPATVPLPAKTPVPAVGKHMKCSACGSRKINTKPELYPGGVEAMRGGR